VNDLKKNSSFLLKKYKIMGGWGATIGGGIGGYISAIKGNYIYAGIGAGLGSIVGIMITLILGQKINNIKIFRSNGNFMYIVWGLASFLLAAGGIISFIYTKEWVLLVCAIFFVACGLYYFLTKDRINI